MPCPCGGPLCEAGTVGDTPIMRCARCGREHVAAARVVRPLVEVGAPCPVCGGERWTATTAGQVQCLACGVEAEPERLRRVARMPAPPRQRAIT